jgi:hypothetical protein
MRERFICLKFLIIFMAINIRWHSAHKLSAEPTVEEKIEWHRVHEKNCDCTPFPKKLKDEAASRGISLK